MGKKVLNFTYTLATLDEKSRVKLYFSPTHNDPKAAIEHLLNIREKYAGEQIGVVKTVIEILDEHSLREEIDAQANPG